MGLGFGVLLLRWLLRDLAFWSWGFWGRISDILVECVFGFVATYLNPERLTVYSVVACKRCQASTRMLQIVVGLCIDEPEEPL